MVRLKNDVEKNASYQLLTKMYLQIFSFESHYSFMYLPVYFLPTALKESSIEVYEKILVQWNL